MIKRYRCKGDLDSSERSFVEKEEFRMYKSNSLSLDEPVPL